MNAEIKVTPWPAYNKTANRVWQVEISHSEKLNAMTRSMWVQLRSVFEQLQLNSDVRCILIKGQGSSFCAGGDISEYPNFRFDPSALRDFHESDVWGGLSAMLACDVPMVAAIEGACMGAGLEIACCCDIRLATHSAKFGAPIAKLGFPMAPKELNLVSSSVGMHAAKRMLLQAEVLSAREMAQSGWCASPLSAEQLQQQLQHTVQRISSLAPQAARLNKQTMRALMSDMPIDSPYAYALSVEHKEGISAFLEKRLANF